MERRSQVAQAVLLFLGYTAAVIVSCITAFVVLILLAVVARPLGETGEYLILIPTGFAGVLAGTFCLPSRSRVSGSIVLVALGIAVSVFEICLSRKYETWESHAEEILHTTLLAVGGAAAVVFFFVRRQHKKPTEQTDVPPLSSNP